MEGHHPRDRLLRRGRGRHAAADGVGLRHDRPRRHVGPAPARARHGGARRRPSPRRPSPGAREVLSARDGRAAHADARLRRGGRHRARPPRSPATRSRERPGRRRSSTSAGRYTNRYVASFIGFLPASAPRVVVAVVIDEPRDRLRRRRRRAGVLGTWPATRSSDWASSPPPRSRRRRTSRPRREPARRAGRLAAVGGSFPLARFGDVAAAVGAEVRGDPATLRGRRRARLARRAARGRCSSASPGDRIDGHEFAADAVARGRRRPRGGAMAARTSTLPQARVPRCVAAMGPMSADGVRRARDRRCGWSRSPGRTARRRCTYLLEAVFAGAGLVPGVIGTTGARAGATPLAARPHDAGGARSATSARRGCAMPASGRWRWRCPRTRSPSERVDAIGFDVAVFTNLSQDHLDFHGRHGGVLRGEGALFTPDRARARRRQRRRRVGTPARPRSRRCR